MSFPDHFSNQASDYAKYRPGYPQALFDWLESLTPLHRLAWDAGTGNGQAALQLATCFDQVVATDPSATQIRNAVAHDKIVYRVQRAENSDLPSCSVDLITVAQALHWFDFELFYVEVERVLKPDGAFAAWTYMLNEVTPEVDLVVRHFYQKIVGPYWPPERKHVDAGYRTIPFPLAEIQAPSMRMETRWTLHDYLGYMHTWSATERYRQANNCDPVALISSELASAWGSQSERLVYWPLHILAGRTQQPASDKIT